MYDGGGYLQLKHSLMEESEPCPVITKTMAFSLKLRRNMENLWQRSR
jgi:hypothetical protein